MKENRITNFITIEGGEGVGKTTVINLLEIKLKAKGYDVLVTREPGGETLAEEIRHLILNNEMQLKTEILLFAAARSEHLDKVILPALNSGKIVLCDRYVDSSIVYQQFVQQGKNVLEINQYATDGVLPQYTFLFDLKPEIALKRIKVNSRDENRFDKKELEFHQKVYDSYNLLAEQNKERIVKIDAGQTSEQISQQILKKMGY